MSINNLMMKHFFAAFALLFSGMLHAQWDTLNTQTNIRLNGIAADPTMGVLAVGFNPSSVSGACGVIEASGDDGNTWTEITEPYAPNLELWDVDYTPNGRTWVIGDSGFAALRTIWFPVYNSFSYISQYSLRCGYPVNDSVFYCAGENGIAYRTMDYGLTWDTLSSGTTETINDIYFADAANGWIVADGGYLAVTSDSGSTWTFVSQPLFGFYDLNSISYQDTSGVNPFVVGEFGQGQFSINGGVNWFSFATGTSQNINCIRFKNTLAGIMCGNGGYIHRTENGGASWISDSSETAADLFDIAYYGDTMAFICGDSGVVLRSRIDISSIQENSIATLAGNVYPNPGMHEAAVSVLLNEPCNVTIQLVDIWGRPVMTDYYENVSAGEKLFALDVEPLASGLYFVVVMNDESSLVLRWLKK